MLTTHLYVTPESRMSEAICYHEMNRETFTLNFELHIRGKATKTAT